MNKKFYKVRAGLYVAFTDKYGKVYIERDSDFRLWHAYDSLGMSVIDCQSTLTDIKSCLGI